MNYMFDDNSGDMGNEGITPEISQVTPKTIWVNGCFDVIHAGHIEMLKYAYSLGQRLVVGLDTDERVLNNQKAQLAQLIILLTVNV